MKIVAVHCRLFTCGTLDARIPQITDEHKIATTKALASFIQNPGIEHIIPSAFDEGVADKTANAIKNLSI